MLLDFDKLAQLIPLLHAGKLCKSELYAAIFSFTPISSASFSNLLFEWRALKIISFEKETKLFVINKPLFLQSLNEIIGYPIMALSITIVTLIFVLLQF